MSTAAEKKRKRAPSDARCAWRAMDDEQRRDFLRWIRDDWPEEQPDNWRFRVEEIRVRGFVEADVWTGHPTALP